MWHWSASRRRWEDVRIKPETIDEPIVEAIMIGGPGTQGHSFISVGRKVSRP